MLTLSTSDASRLSRITAAAGRVILAIDGLQPDVGHEVLWVIRDVIPGEVLLAKSLLSSTQDDLAGLLGEVRDALDVPIAGVVSDGQASIRKAVAEALSGVPHQLCTSITCEKRPCRSTRPTDMPRSSSRRRSAASGRSSGSSRGGVTPRPSRCGATARRCVRR